MATVIIWNNNHNICRGRHTVTGHAALNILDKWTSFGIDNDKTYVSWWPSGRKGGVASDSFLDDINDEAGYAPDHVIRIPENQLKISEMSAKWHEIRTKKNASYKYYKKNCSTIVSRVLKAGSNKGSILRRHHSIWTPLRVKRLAYDMGGEELAWLDFVEELTNTINIESILKLKQLKRRSSHHGPLCAAPPRFNQGVDTGKTGLKFTKPPLPFLAPFMEAEDSFLGLPDDFFDS